MKPTRSIRRRLVTYLGIGLTLTWLVTVLGGLVIALHEIDEVADSQMSVLARTLMLVSNPAGHPQAMPDIESLLADRAGDAEDEDNSFAVWDEHGVILMANRTGRSIPFQRLSGFQNSRPVWQAGAWRYLYLHDADSQHTVAVGQRMAERFEAAWHTLWLQFLVSALSLPVLLGILVFGIKRGLRPLTRLADELARRDARSLQPVSESVPAEALPMVRSLNALLTRVSEAMSREQRFTADAAHELRSPLAALKVQAEVLAMTEDPAEQQHHVANLLAGIDRASHLTDQLLTFARLDPLEEIPDARPVNWRALAESVLKSVSLAAREKRMVLKLDDVSGGQDILPLNGNAVLLQLMLRNLLDNAIRYSPERRCVRLVLGHGHVSVCDEGGGIPAEHLPRIRERFYRPAGQQRQGSGLGLSIVESIAALHGLKVVLENRPGQGLSVHLRRQD